MSFLDKIAAAVMPPESDQDRADARRKAQSVATPGEWLEVILDQHRQIEAAFLKALTSGDAATRKTALKELAVVLTGHANAEESVIYPALADTGEKGHAGVGYEEQAMVKIEMAKLEMLDPMGKEWREKLEHIRGAVLHHMYEEEGTWFPKLHEKLPESHHAQITRRFLEEFSRYAGNPRQMQPQQMAAEIPNV